MFYLHSFALSAGSFLQVASCLAVIWRHGSGDPVGGVQLPAELSVDDVRYFQTSVNFIPHSRREHGIFPHSCMLFLLVAKRETHRPWEEEALTLSVCHSRVLLQIYHLRTHERRYNV